jgi:hypothetical protein
MSDAPTLINPEAADIYIVPAHAGETTERPIRDEETRLLRDEMGIPMMTEEIWD